MQKIQKFPLFALPFVAFLLATPVRAEDSDPERGRLPDGRAFRTDAQGNQLVDYIAELELSVEQLTRRVHGLEFEVEEKQNQIARLSQSGATTQDVEERDLLGSRARQTGSVDRAASVAAAPADCSAQVAPVQQLLEKARFDLDVSRRVQDKSRAEYEDNVEKLRAQYSSLSCPKVDCSAEVTRASSQGLKLQQELSQTQAAAAAERQAQQGRIQEYETTLVRLKADLAARDEKLRDMQMKLAVATTTEAKAPTVVALAQQQQLKVAPIDRVVSEPVVASSSKPLEVAALNANTQAMRATQPQLFSPPTEERASFSAAKTRAVDSLRGSMTQDLRRLRDLIVTRDSLFQSYNQSGRALSFKPSPLVSSRGYTFSWVSERVKSATNIYELSSLARDIREIRSRVQEDIDLINRMKRKGE